MGPRADRPVVEARAGEPYGRFRPHCRHSNVPVGFSEVAVPVRLIVSVIVAGDGLSVLRHQIAYAVGQRMDVFPTALEQRGSRHSIQLTRGGQKVLHFQDWTP